MTHSHVSQVLHNSFTCAISVTWPIHMCHKCYTTHSYTRYASFIQIRDMPSSYVRHASFICATCLIHMCDMPHSYTRHASFTCATCLIHMRDTPHPHVRDEHNRAYDTSKLYRDLKLRGAVIKDKELLILPGPSPPFPTSSFLFSLLVSIWWKLWSAVIKDEEILARF